MSLMSWFKGTPVGGLIVGQVPVSEANPLPVAISQATVGTTNAVVESARTIVANQSIAYTGTAGTSAAVNSNSTEVIVTLTTDGYIAIGANPTATTGDMFLPAYVPSPPLKVTGATSKISAIRDTASGTMKIAEFSR